MALGLFRRSLSFLLLCQSRSLLLLSFRSTFFGGFAVSFGLSAAAGVFFRLGRSSVGLAFGQGAAASIFLRLRLGSSGVGLGPFALFLHAPLISRNTFFLFLAKGQDARVFSGLSGATSGGAVAGLAMGRLAIAGRAVVSRCGGVLLRFRFCRRCALGHRSLLGRAALGAQPAILLTPNQK